MTAARYVFIFWGRNFDGAAATIFVSELRQAGLRVKVVGLDGDLPVGMNGVTLVPDIPLSKALPQANRASCIIVPCQASHWSRIQQDPRLVDLLVESQQVGALLVVAASRCEGMHGQSNVFHLLVDRLKALMPTIQEYPAHEGLTGFARALAGGLG